MQLPGSSSRRRCEPPGNPGDYNRCVFGRKGQMKSPTRYSPEVRQRAVRLVLDHQGEHDSQWSAITSVSSKLGCTAETLRKWVRQAERDRGVRAGFTSEERRRLKELERENRELRRANEILRKASAYLLALCAAQSISAPALVTVGLCDPVADRLGGGLELSTFGRQQHRHSQASSSGVRPVRTSSTIWRRKAGRYGGLDFGIVDASSPKGQVSTKSGQLHERPRRDGGAAR